MKFKEKDPIVSMEQWFPDKPLEYVKEFNGGKEIRSQYTIYVNTNEDFERRNISDYGGHSIVSYEFQKTKVYLIEFTENGKTYWATKFGEASLDGSCGQRHMPVFVTPGDWVLTYQSGRREVLTDKEKQERFE